jgi:hypothetical protein
VAAAFGLFASEVIVNKRETEKQRQEREFKAVIARCEQALRGARAIMRQVRSDAEQARSSARRQAKNQSSAKKAEKGRSKTGI